MRNLKCHLKFVASANKSERIKSMIQIHQIAKILGLKNDLGVFYGALKFGFWKFWRKLFFGIVLTLYNPSYFEEKWFFCVSSHEIFC